MGRGANTAHVSERAAAAVLIRAEHLRVRYGERWALDDLSFAAGAGEIIGLLGPNGAGKTTTLSVLATLLRPDAGTAVIAGHDVRTDAGAVRRVLGIVPQALALYPTLTARENVLFFARLLGLRRAAVRPAAQRALELVGLEERADDAVTQFSGGMRRRLNLACGILHGPRVLLLDEPTVGVDPQSRERIFGAVRAQAHAGSAVVYSTHYLEEAEWLCDRVVLIDHGRVIATGTPAALISEIGSGIRLEIITRARLDTAWIAGVAGARPLGAVDEALPAGRGARVQITLDDLAAAPTVLARAAAAGGEVLEFHVHQPDLQDVFLKLTGRALRD